MAISSNPFLQRLNGASSMPQIQSMSQSIPSPPYNANVSYDASLRNHNVSFASPHSQQPADTAPIYSSSNKSDLGNYQSGSSRHDDNQLSNSLSRLALDSNDFIPDSSPAVQISNDYLYAPASSRVDAINLGKQNTSINEHLDLKTNINTQSSNDSPEDQIFK
jgi:hypothetical protein